LYCQHEEGKSFIQPKMMIKVTLSVLNAKKITDMTMNSVERYEWDRYEPFELNLSCVDGEVRLESNATSDDFARIQTEADLVKERADFLDIREMLMNEEEDDDLEDTVMNGSTRMLKDMTELAFRYFNAIKDDQEPLGVKGLSLLDEDDEAIRETNIKTDKWTLFAHKIDIEYSVEELDTASYMIGSGYDRLRYQ
jgi:hypothetical protein